MSSLFLCWELCSPLLIAQSCSSLGMQQEYQLHEALSASLGSQPLWIDLGQISQHGVKMHELWDLATRDPSLLLPLAI